MYLTTDIDNLLEDNKFRFMNESITYKAMQRRLNKLFKKQHNVEFKIEKYDDFENDAISFSGIYDMFEEKTYIILNVSDLWPQSAIDLSVMKEDSIVHKIFKRIEKL